MDELYKKFTKLQVLAIATELKIKGYKRFASSQLQSKDMCDAITKELNANGLPEDLSDVADDTFNFLIDGGWVDADGNIIEPEAAKVEEVEEPSEIKLPGCFGLEDDLDPACKHCRVQDRCRTQRIASRPSCFGKMFSANEPECKACIEAIFCRPIVEGLKHE
jgi:hypothetical protein